MTPQQNRLTIAFKMPTDKEMVDLFFSHTEHSYQRARRRSLHEQKIAAVLKFGKVIYKQGLLFYILGEKDVPEHLKKEKDKLRNTVVIVSGASNEIITCYRSANPFKNIRVKKKQLARKRFAA